jgi:hypothetical protein
MRQLVRCSGLNLQVQFRGSLILAAPTDSKKILLLLSGGPLWKKIKSSLLGQPGRFESPQRAKNLHKKDSMINYFKSVCMA